MTTTAALLMIAALNSQGLPGPSPAMMQATEQPAPHILLAQAGTSAPAPSIGAPAPTPKLEELPDGPPLGSLSLSQLILKVEGEPEFAYVRDVAWEDGKYRVTFVTRNGETHEKAIDPRTGRETGRAGQTGGSGSDSATPGSESAR